MSQLTKHSSSIILASISGLAAFSPAIADEGGPAKVTDNAQVVFQEDFNGYADGAFPSSLIEVQRCHYRYAEVRDRWLAINMGGNPLLLLAPAVRDFSFSWQARAETGSEQLPVEISFRADGNLDKRAILALFLKENTCDLTLSRPGNAPLRLTDLPAPVRSVQDSRRFEVEVAGDVLTVKIDGKEIHSFQKAALPPGAGYVTIGFSQNAGLGGKVALPVFLKNLRLTSRDAGTPPIEKIWVHEFPIKIPNDIFVNFKDWNADVKERVTIERIRG
ncbi:MAG: hypothetical protein WCP55_24875, partial [Lentisphaerota bacterium]